MNTPSDSTPEFKVYQNRTLELEFQCYEGDQETELVVEVTDVFRFKLWSTNGSSPEIDADSVALPSGGFTADAGTDVCTDAAHGLAANDAVRLTTTGTLPAGLSLNTTYWIRDVTTDTFKLAATCGGSAVDITGAGTGTHTWTQTKSKVTVDSVGVANTTPATVTVQLDQVDTSQLTADAYYHYELALVDDDDDDKIKPICRGQMRCLGSATGDIGLS